jgi:hypothetical protein
MDTLKSNHDSQPISGKIETTTPKRIEDYLKEKKELTANTSLNLQGLQFSTWNDNAPLTLPGTTAGDDSGKTFDIKLGATFAKNNREYAADAQLTHYTDGEIVRRDRDGTWYIDSQSAKRVDRLSLGLRAQVLNIIHSDGSYIRANLGGGVQTLGNYGWQSIQKEWHKLNNYYQNDAKYEQWWRGITADIRGWIDAKKYIVGSQEKGIYFKWWADIVLPMSEKIWVTRAEGSVGIGANFKNFSVEVSHNEAYEHGSTGSSVIQGAMKNGQYQSYNAVDINIPISKSTSLFGWMTDAWKGQAGATGDIGEVGFNVGIKKSFR